MVSPSGHLRILVGINTKVGQESPPEYCFIRIDEMSATLRTYAETALNIKGLTVLRPITQKASADNDLPIARPLKSVELPAPKSSSDIIRGDTLTLRDGTQILVGNISATEGSLKMECFKSENGRLSLVQNLPIDSVIKDTVSIKRLSFMGVMEELSHSGKVDVFSLYPLRGTCCQEGLVEGVEPKHIETLTKCLKDKGPYSSDFWLRYGTAKATCDLLAHHSSKMTRDGALSLIAAIDDFFSQDPLRHLLDAKHTDLRLDPKFKRVLLAIANQTADFVAAQLGKE